MQKIYENALKEGTTEVYRTRIMLVGHFAAGKTSVLRSLVNEDFREEHVTTDGVETEETVKVQLSEVKEEGSAFYKWEKVCSTSNISQHYVPETSFISIIYQTTMTVSMYDNILTTFVSLH